MKVKCVICGNAKGKRECLRKNNDLICPPCCAVSRNGECEECGHFRIHEQYKSEKLRNAREKPFLAVIDPMVDAEVEEAGILIEKGDLSEAEKIISPLVAEHPMNHSVQFVAGALNAAGNNIKDALDCFDKAIDIFPYFAEAYYNKGSCHQKLLDVKNMIKAYQKVMIYGDKEEYYYKRAKSILDNLARSTADESGLTLDEFVKLNDRYDEAVSFMDRKDYEKSLRIFNECLDRNPRHPQTLNNIGLCHLFLGRPEESVKFFERALEISPDYEPARNNLYSAKNGFADKPEEFQHVSIDYAKEKVLSNKSLSGIVKDIFNKRGA
ncbi:MAG: tetratricopeptide repeat protein [Victivallales bacterium]